MVIKVGGGSASQVHDTSELTKKEAAALVATVKAQGVVPDFKDVKTAPDKSAAKQNAPAPTGREQKNLEKAGQGAGHAALDCAKKNDLGTAANVLIALKDEPAAKAAAMDVLKWSRFSDIVLAAPAEQRAELISKFGTSFKPEERLNLAHWLAAKGDLASAAHLIGQAGKHAPAMIDKIFGLGGVTFDKLFAAARDDGAAVQALSQHYYTKNIASHETAFGRDLERACAPTVQALSGQKPKVSEADVKYMIATGDLPPHVEAFIKDALASKDPKKLELAQKLVDVRELALADRFAAQIPFEMDQATRTKWKNEWAAHEQLSDNLAAARGQWVDTKNTTLADMVFDAIDRKDSTQAFEALDPRGRNLFARLTSTLYVPDANSMGAKPFGARGVGELALHQWEPSDQRDLGHWAQLASYGNESSREFNEAFVREAAQGGAFAKELAAVAKDNKDPKVRAWAQGVLDEAKARQAHAPAATDKTRKAFADAKLDPHSKDFAKKAADLLLSDAFETSRAEAIACFEATYGMTFAELTARVDPARAEKLTVGYGASLSLQQSRDTIDALAAKGKSYDDAVHGLIYAHKKDHGAEERLIDRALYRGITKERLMKSASDSRWDRDNYRPTLKSYLDKHPDA